MKNLKFLLAALLIVGLGLFAASCSSDNPPPVTIDLKVAPGSLDFTAAGGDKELTVTTTATWSHKVADGATWLTATKAGDKINVAAAANTGEARTATITVSAPNAKDVVVTVTQAKKATGETPTLTVDPKTASFAAAGGEELLAVATNVATWAFALEAGADWLTVTKPSATQLKLVAANYTSTTADRTAKITVSAEGATDVVVTVTQAKFAASLPLSYEILAHNYYVAGTPVILEKPDISSWSTQIIEVDNVVDFLFETYEQELGYEAVPGSKYLALNQWGSKLMPIVLEYTSENTIAYPQIPLLISEDNYLAMQDILGLNKAGTTIYLLTLEGNKQDMQWDPATRSIYLTSDTFYDNNDNPMELDLIPAILAYDPVTIKFMERYFSDGYKNLKMTQTTPLAAPSYAGAPMPSRNFNLAKSPYRDLEIVDARTWKQKN